MINFNSFVHAIHDAILKANDALMDKNTDLLNKYFIEKTVPVTDSNKKPVLDENNQPVVKVIHEPVSVILDYPNLDENGDLNKTEIHVPLITLVPLTSSQIEKATLTAEFDMQIVDGSLQIDFVNRTASTNSFFSKPKTSRGTLEIIISPQETSEGLKLLIEGYETLLKKQIP